jgi:hypothetical protein
MLIIMAMGQSSTNHVPLKTDGTESENYMEAKGYHYYKIRIPDTYVKGEDLLITVKGLDAKSDPDLHVSKTNTAPQSMNDSEYNCAMVGEDICTIPAHDLHSGQILYVGAKCFKQCTYSISAKLMSEIKLEGRKDYRVSVKAGDKKIFTFTNPHPGVKSLVFTARADRNTAGMRMYIKEGIDGVPTTSDMRSHEGWENGIVIRITDKTVVKVVEEGTYKLLFEADDDALISMRVDLLYHEKEIDEGVVYEDYVNYNDRQCYKYMIKSPEKKFRVGAYSFSGNPDIYINPGSIPDKLEDFTFKATEPSDDVIVLSVKDREDAGAKKGDYFICIVGHSSTSYRLRVVESDNDYFLEDGIAETNEISSGKEATFYYTDSALVRDLNLTFTLSVKSGPVPDMYVKFCGRTPQSK